MVSFLLDNSLGAWWAARRLTTEDFKSARSEDELRRKAALPGVPLKYLRFVKTDDGVWTPAAGTFDEWPEHLDELKTLDPCCGSGHFLVAAFHMLVPMRIELEGLSAAEAVDAVLRDNLHGLEIDQRCGELAAFALAFAAWRYPGAGGYRKLPELNIACSGLSVSVPKAEWKKLANGDKNLSIALDVLYDQFLKAPVLGSLLNPARSEAALLVEWTKLAQAMEKALQKERPDEEYEVGVVAKGLAKAAEMLASRYYWVITNVPYLVRGKQNDTLKEYCADFYRISKNDLATVFLERCLEFCEHSGNVSIVLPQNWLFQKSYSSFRKKIHRNNTWRTIARLGPGAFETISGEVVKAILFIISRSKVAADDEFIFSKHEGNLLHHLNILDVSTDNGVIQKRNKLISSNILSIEQSNLLKGRDAVAILDLIDFGKSLSEFADCYEGLSSGDIQRFIKTFWEVNVQSKEKWSFLMGSVSKNVHYGGREQVLLWEGGNGDFVKFPGSYLKGARAWGKQGIRITLMYSKASTIYTGELFDKNAGSIIPNKNEDLLYIWAYCQSPEFKDNVEKVNQNLYVPVKTILQVPFDKEKWKKVAAKKYPYGLPKPYSDDPTQWIFHGHPCGSVVFNEHTGLLEHGSLRIDNTVLQVAVVRLLGYRWPAEQDPEMELSDESREWVKRCEALLPFADRDGIVCIPPVRGEAGAADRLLDLLAAAYGDQWSMDILSRLLEQVDHAGKTLETWLRDKFFSQHCKLFHHRPFIWHIWDGLRDGFSALVNYHRLDRKNLETLTYTYLGDWISRQKQDLDGGIDGAAEKLAAAENLKKRLELILEGEKPYDIFIRWKPIEQQPIGWDPDLNDGVRLNIRPFLAVPPVGKKGAGILRDKPNINWNKDRGKDVPSAPWYHKFKGDRINYHHLTLAEKRIAREERSNDVLN